MPRRVMTGRVVSDKMDKTVIVLVERRVRDRIYKKTIRRSKRFKAHDESNEVKVGDVVAIEECARISKDKAWRVIAAAGAATTVEAAKEEIGA